MNEGEDDLYGDDEAAAPVQKVGDGAVNKPPAGKMENVAALGRNPKTSRVIIATVGAVVLVGSIAVIGIVSKRNKPEAAAPAELSGAAVGAPPVLNDDKGSPLGGSDQYKDIVAAASKERSQDALANGTSAQPLAATVESTLKSAPTPAEAAASAAAAEKARLDLQEAERAKAMALAAQQAQATYPQNGAGYQQVQYQQPQNPQGDQVYQQHLTNAQAAFAQLMAPRARGAQVYGLVDVQSGAGGTQATGPQSGGTQVAAAANSGAAGSQGAATASSGGQVTLIGAGVIESARLEMGVNTDVGGDFVATLLTGRWAGAKLIGSVQRRGELAALTVRTMSLPAQGVSVAATAVILDPETNEGGTATDVDRKLFIKYGVKPVAAGFAAVADYLKNSGTTVVVSGETVTTSQPELTNKKAGQIIGGAAAAQVSSDANALDTTPTVRVRRGAIVGVFFTQDVLYSPK